MARVQRIIALGLAAGLIAAAAIAFVVVQKLKSEPPLVSAPDFSQAHQFSTTCDLRYCKRHVARFSIALHRPGRIDVAVVDADGHDVRRLLTNARRRGRVHLVWNGRKDDGRPAPDGTYRLRIRLRVARTTIRLRNTIALDTAAPRVSASLPTGRTMAPGGHFRFTVRSSEQAAFSTTVFQVLGDGTVKPVYKLTRSPHGLTARLDWRGVIGRSKRPAPGGTYVVGVQVRDASGNVTDVPARFAPGALAPAVAVRVQTVEIGPDGRIASPAALVSATEQRLAGRFPRTVVWQATGPPETLRAPRQSRPGIYALAAVVGSTIAWEPQAFPGAAPVLVMLPTYTWQTVNPYDADADGFPDVPPAPLALGRPLGSLGRSDLERLSSLVASITGSGTAGAVSDQSIEGGGVPRRCRLLVIAGARVWTPGLISRIRSFQLRGGRVLVLSAPLDQRADRAGPAIVVHPAGEVAPLQRSAVFHRVGPALAFAARARR